MITASSFSFTQTYALCDIGFQGLRHDEVTGNIYQRAREYSPSLARFLQRDPLGYPDGMNTYAAYHVMYGGLDPWGTRIIVDEWDHWNTRKITDTKTGLVIHQRLDDKTGDVTTTARSDDPGYLGEGAAASCTTRDASIQKGVNDVKTVGKVAATGLLVGTVFIPGPEDAIIAGLAARGRVIVKSCGWRLIRRLVV